MTCEVKNAKNVDICHHYQIQHQSVESFHTEASPDTLQSPFIQITKKNTIEWVMHGKHETCRISPMVHIIIVFQSNRLINFIFYSTRFHLSFHPFSLTTQSSFIFFLFALFVFKLQHFFLLTWQGPGKITAIYFTAPRLFVPFGSFAHCYTAAAGAERWLNNQKSFHSLAEIKQKKTTAQKQGVHCSPCSI